MVAVSRLHQQCGTAGPLQNKGRSRDLCAAQAHGGTGVRHPQVGNGLPSVSAARSGECSQRVDAGLPRVEFEAHGRVASAAIKRTKALLLYGKATRFQPEMPEFISDRETEPSAGLKSDRLVGD